MNILTRKKKLLSQFPDFMKGSISLTSRSCGKTSGKRCQAGGKHPVYLFGFAERKITKLKEQVSQLTQEKKSRHLQKDYLWQSLRAGD